MQSTSANSILMMSLDVARRNLAVHGKERIGLSIEAANKLRQGVRDAGRFEELSDRFLASPGIVAVDPLRVVIDTRRGESAVMRPARSYSTSTASTSRWPPTALSSP